MTERRWISWAMGLVLTLGLGLVALPLETPAHAAPNNADFRPGNIIDDAVFYDSGAMTLPQIQAFLDERGTNCTAGVPACLKDYTTATTTRPAEPGLCREYVGRVSETAAEIIFNVAQACGINPQSLLVLLEKEQSLVGRARPTMRAYEIATGFGCPDTAPCNTEYYGFYNQVYRAARQFNRYRVAPTSYGYQAGRANTIYFNPTASCGSTSVYIENQATAGLYNYTPYQPNTALLSGQVTECASWGNLNFWRLFTSWFGDTHFGQGFVKAAGSPEVYFVAGTARHFVPSMTLVASTYASLGPIRTVSATALAALPIRGDLTPTFLDSSTGKVYLVDRGRRYFVSTCALVADFGSSCSSLPSLSVSQTAAFTEAGNLSASVVVDGARYQAVSGTLREVFDTTALTSAGFPNSPAVTLSASAVSHLLIGKPVVRDRTVLLERTSNRAWVWESGTRHETTRDVIVQQPTLASLPSAELNRSSIDQLDAGFHLTGTVGSTGGPTFLMTTLGLSMLPSGSSLPGPVPLFSPAFLATFPQTSATTTNVFVKSTRAPTIFFATSGRLRAVETWPSLVAYAGTATPQYHTVPEGVLQYLGAPDAPLLTPGSVVKSEHAPDLFLVTGPATIQRIDDMALLGDLSLGAPTTVLQRSLNFATRTPGQVSTIVECGARNYIAQRGVLRELTGQLDGGVPLTHLHQSVCGTKTIATGALRTPVFVKAADSPVVFLIQGGLRRQVNSWSTVLNLAAPGQPAVAVLGAPLLTSMPSGSAIP